MKKYTKHFIVIAIILFVAFCSLTVRAQPSKSDRSSTEYADRLRENAAEQKRMRDNEDQRSRAKPNQSTPNKPSSSSGTKYRFEIAREKKEQDERYEREVAEEAAAAELKKKQDAEEEVRRKDVAEKRTEKRKKNEDIRAARLKKRDDYMERTVTDYKGCLSTVDKADFSRDVVYAWRFKLEKDKDQTKAIKEFESEKNTSDFDRLLSLAISAERHAEFATSAFEHLLTRFPDRKEDIEQASLAAMPYYFGARRQDVLRRDPRKHPDDFEYYPASIYEVASAAEKNMLLQRFKTLATKYPAEALKAAGKCRNQLNPFLLLAEQSEANEEECAAFHMKVLYSDYRSVTPTKAAEYSIAKEETAPWYEIADLRMRPSVLYLMKYRRKQMRALKTEDWLEIAKLQGFHVDYIIHAFESPSRLDKDIKNYGSWRLATKELPSLRNARDFKP